MAESTKGASFVSSRTIKSPRGTLTLITARPNDVLAAHCEIESPELTNRQSGYSSRKLRRARNFNECRSHEREEYLIVRSAC